MQKFDRWQPVEIKLDDDAWIEARYVAPYDDKVSPLAHTVGVIDGGELTEAQVSDAEIRPAPCFSAAGDEVALLAGLLAEAEQRMVNHDMSNHGTIGPEAAAVNAMMRRCWAAMEATR